MAAADSASGRVTRNSILEQLERGEAGLMDAWSLIHKLRVKPGITVDEACRVLPASSWHDHHVDAIGLVGLSPTTRLREASREQIAQIVEMLASGCLFPRWPSFPWWPDPNPSDKSIDIATGEVLIDDEPPV